MSVALGEATINNIITSSLPGGWWLGVDMEIWARQNVLLSNSSGIKKKTVKVMSSYNHRATSEKQEV